MKILGVHSAILPEANKQSQVDHWRIYRPLRELAAHTDWTIDHSPTFILGFDKYKNKEQFTNEEMENAFKILGQYDIVFSSYHPDPTAYTLLKAAARRTGTQFVMDCDDDMFAINPDNPFWMKMTDEKVYWMQRMIADNHWLVTPSEVLAERFRERRQSSIGFDGQELLLTKDSVTVIPNYIADVYHHEPFDNGDTIVIGYMGGASHYADLHETGVLEAIQRLMHENKKIRFKCIGMVVDTYIPKARFDFEPGKRGTDFFEQIYPNLNFDIAIAPLVDNIFNWGKSNIKWQEMTRAGSAFIASDIGPYTTLKDRSNAILVRKNSVDQWYAALKELVENKKLRQDLVQSAQRDVMLHWRLEDNWVKYKDLFKRVGEKKTNANHRTESGLFAGQAK